MCLRNASTVLALSYLLRGPSLEPRVQGRSCCDARRACSLWDTHYRPINAAVKNCLLALAHRKVAQSSCRHALVALPNKTLLPLRGLKVN